MFCGCGSFKFIKQFWDFVVVRHAVDLCCTCDLGPQLAAHDQQALKSALVCMMTKRVPVIPALKS